MIRPIAIHLPQFHPFAENDEWWGKGFTEWTNVTKAKPLYEGHYQPHLPADLGFYDLRLEEARVAQEVLAKQYGIYGFCYYHYWFTGKRLMNEPIDRKLKNPKEDLPFMLCWANENWTRRWDGNDQEVLIEQKYSDQDNEEHIKYLLQLFKDERYIRVNNKPIIIIYKPNVLTNIQGTLACWREAAKVEGLELYICHMVFSHTQDWNKLLDGFDAALDFEPFGIRRKNVFQKLQEIHNQPSKKPRNIFKRIFEKKNDKVDFNNLPYEWMRENLKSHKDFDFKLYPSLVPGWDNTSRRGNNPTLILDDSKPEKFEKWLHKITEDFVPFSDDENFIFINAWNEWAEGNHLEPDTKFGSQYLEVLKKTFKDK